MNIEIKNESVVITDKDGRESEMSLLDGRGIIELAEELTQEETEEANRITFNKRVIKNYLNMSIVQKEIAKDGDYSVYDWCADLARSQEAEELRRAPKRRVPKK